MTRGDLGQFFRCRSTAIPKLKHAYRSPIVHLSDFPSDSELLLSITTARTDHRQTHPVLLAQSATVALVTKQPLDLDLLMFGSTCIDPGNAERTRRDKCTTRIWIYIKCGEEVELGR